MSNERPSAQQACNSRSIEVTINNLPLSCPPAGKRIWDAHPCVYLPIEEQKTVVCPYCSTKYTLKEEFNAL
jgi:uncharacterized Zn-finger protein